MKNSITKYLVYYVKLIYHFLLKNQKYFLIVAFIIIFFSLKNKAPVIIDNISKIQFSYIFISFIFLICHFIFYSLTQWVLLGGKYSYKKNMLIMASTSLYRYLPGGIWDQVFRIGKYKKLSEVEATKKIIFAQINYIIAATILSITYLLILFFGYETNFLDFNQINTIVILYFFLVLIFSSIYLLIAFWVIKLRKKSINEKTVQKKKIIYSLIYSFLAWFSANIAFFFVAKSLIEINLHQTLYVLDTYVLSWLAGYLFPIAPNGFGIRELVLTKNMTFLVAIDVGLALFIALLFRFLIILRDVFLGVSALLLEKIITRSQTP